MKNLLAELHIHLCLTRKSIRGTEATEQILISDRIKGAEAETPRICGRSLKS